MIINGLYVVQVGTHRSGTQVASSYGCIVQRFHCPSDALSQRPMPEKTYRDGILEVNVSQKKWGQFYLSG
jgi:hypothetical protein